MDSQITINTIVWAADSLKAQEIAANFTNGPSEPGFVFVRSTPEFTLKTYIRSPNSVSNQSPGGIADVLILYVSSADSGELEQAKAYVDSRRGIPIKVLCSENPLLDEATTLDCKYVNVSEVTGEGRETIIKEARKFEETLVNCFKKFDINGNGLISVDELMKVSEELGHHLEHDDAKMIADSLDETKSNSGNINLEGFKKWWVMGKRDFHAFRRICKAEMSVNKLIKLTSKKFNSYLENLQENSEKLSQEEVLQGINLNLHSKQSFENGFGFFLEICSGPEAKEAINSFPDAVKNSPAAVSVRVGFSNAEAAQGVYEILNQLVNAMLAENPLVQPYLQMGLQYGFRTSGNFLVLDVSIGGLMADLVINQSQEFSQLKKLDLNGNLTLHVFSSITLHTLLNEIGVFNLLEKFLHLKLHFNSKTYGLRQFWSQFSTQFKENMSEVPGMRKIVMLVESLLILRSFNLDLSFDAVEAKKTFVDLLASDIKWKHNDSVEEAKAHLLSGNAKPDREVQELRDTFTGYKAMAENMKEMIPEEFLPIIKSVNLERFELEVPINMPHGTALVKTTLNLPGLNAVRDEIFP